MGIGRRTVQSCVERVSSHADDLVIIYGLHMFDKEPRPRTSMGHDLSMGHNIDNSISIVFSSVSHSEPLSFSRFIDSRVNNTPAFKRMDGSFV